MGQMADVLDWGGGMASSELERCLALMAVFTQIGFGILAAVPDSGFVYPLLGKPHDSLNLRGDYG